MPCRLSLAAWLLLLTAPLGCGSVTGAGDDDGPSDDADDDGAGDPADASDDPGDDADDDADPGDDGDAPVDPTCTGASGTRLRQHLRRHSDGSSSAVGLLRDTTLGVDCELGLAADGSPRCLPAIFGAPVGGFGQGRRVFASADCTSPLLESFNQPETGLPLYIQDFEYDFSQPCAPPRRRYFEMGADLGIEPGATLYARAVSGCFPFPAQTNARYHAVVRELPETTFVAATAAPSDTGRLGVNVIETEDGARVCGDQGFLHDDQLGRCLPAPDENGQLRCLPGTTEVRQATQEPCEGTAFGVAIVQECQVETAAREPVDVCGGGYRVRALAAALPGPVYEGDTCDVIEGEDAGQQLSRLGDALDPSGFVPLGAGRIRAGARLDRLASTTEAGLVIGAERWFDRELGVECAFQTFGDAARRCVPTLGLGTGVARASVVYSDAGCSAEVLVAAAPFSCEPGGPAPRVAYHERSGGGGGDGPVERTLYEIGARHEGPLHRLGDACEPVGADEVLYTVGPEIPVDSLVAVVDDDQIE